jgi:hypothetical protein
MRVFTQRFQIHTGQQSLLKPKRVEHPAHIPWMEDFLSKFPNVTETLLNENHDLDYMIRFAPFLEVYGFYWGDESMLEAANAFVKAKLDSGLFSTEISSIVLTCNDDQHPIDLQLTEILSAIPADDYVKVTSATFKEMSELNPG